MSKIGYTMGALRVMGVGSVETDVRLVWEKADPWAMALAKVNYAPAPVVLPLPAFCGTREMRLLAEQLLRHADELDAVDQPHEELVP